MEFIILLNLQVTVKVKRGSNTYYELNMLRNKYPNSGFDNHEWNSVILTLRALSLYLQTTEFNKQRVRKIQINYD